MCRSAVADFLLREDIFEQVMSATRGPDIYNEGDNLAYTAVLCWTLGFRYAIKATPSARTFEYAALPDSLYYSRVKRAFADLRDRGWDIDRIPLCAYLDPAKAKETAKEILCCAVAYLQEQGHVDVDDPVLRLLRRAIRKVDYAPATDPDFEIHLPNREDVDAMWL